ncbi:hypothetical protein ARMA_2891 [Ardenticatena maritima]|uniref:Uncharacterized protein n=1 Tax=Ardenticatena maritima TaxID=872965 RepID=A0A0M8KBP1_9CHLR|nr:hypothetical protein ARMA_2891 [Ardenticatena maritima]
MWWGAYHTANCTVKVQSARKKRAYAWRFRLLPFALSSITIKVSARHQNT